MDCCICSTMPSILRPPRNTICGACYEGAKSVISLMNYNKVETDKASSSPNPCNTTKSQQPLANLAKWMNIMKDTEDELKQKINFLSSFVSLYRQKILTDIKVKPGNDGSAVISAHRAILAARSEIFKNMFDTSDACMCIATAEDTSILSLPELKQEEVEAFLEFLYSGSLDTEVVRKHVYALTLAADKYEIPYLMKFCEGFMLASLDTSNALDILEISDVCSNKALKETALNYIITNVEDIVFSPKYEAFVPKNPHLAVHISRAFFMDSKTHKPHTHNV